MCANMSIGGLMTDSGLCVYSFATRSILVNQKVRQMLLLSLTAANIIADHPP